MNTPLPGLPTVKIPPPAPLTKEERIAKSVEKPTAFSKPASLKGTGENRSTRFRPGAIKSGPKNRAIRKKRDPRFVTYY